MITIKFNNPNSRTLTTIDLYRSPVDVPIPDVPTEPPIATLNGFETQYIDHDTVLGQDYNYRFRVYKQGGESTMSPNLVLGDVSLYGPGEYTVAKTGTNRVWNFGQVTDDTLLPSLAELEAIAGGNGMSINWNNSWTKFKIGSSIYYTPYQFAIKIPADDILGFMSRVTANRSFQKGYCHYDHLQYMVGSYASTVLDGRYPVFGNFEKETGRVNPVEYFTGLAGEVPSKGRVIFAVATDTTGQLFAPQTKEYSPALVSSPNFSDPANFDWYWKPVIQFIPQMVKNYDQN